MTTQPARPWESAQAAEIWREGAARRAQVLAQATEQLFDAASLQPGMRLLDVAAGTGDQTVLAARRIGPSGSILATDVSAAMLAGADQNVRAAGLTNVTTLVSDASALELPDGEFDAAICRFGLMFVPDLHQALSRIYRALKPGGRLAALVWATRERNPWMAMQIDVQSEIGRPPGPGASVLQALSLADTDTLARALTAAGFVSVQTSAVATPRTYASIADAMESMQSTSPVQAELLRQLSDAERQQYLSLLQSRLQAFAKADGQVVIPGEAILVVGTR
ncbi:MAG: class I SAM-dependent methyltransferase [Chloroflexi bacterium]|nr:class I SAM-dependent methyltransferase [Chloroflexota bacterium]